MPRRGTPPEGGIKAQFDPEGGIHGSARPRRPTRVKDELYLSYPMTCPGKARRATTGEPEVLQRRHHLPAFAVLR